MRGVRFKRFLHLGIAFAQSPAGRNKLVPRHSKEKKRKKKKMDSRRESTVPFLELIDYLDLLSVSNCFVYHFF